MTPYSPEPTRPQPVEPDRRPLASAVARRYPAFGWLVLIAAGFAALVTGLSLYRTLATPLDAAFIPRAQGWLTGVTVGACVGFLCLVLAAVAVVVGRPRTVPVVALIAAVVLPLFAVVIGGKLGTDLLITHALELGRELSGSLDRIDAEDPRLGSLLRLLVELFT